MTDLQVNALLYDGARVEMDGVVINSWFDNPQAIRTSNLSGAIL